MSYDEIKAKCLRERTLFEDPDFPADDFDNSSLYYDKKKASPATFKWMRPTEMEILGSSKTPEFFVHEASRFDIKQGHLGDCWMMAPMACLGMRPDLIDKVVPLAGQSFDQRDYAGIFRFRIWRFGEWVDVIIDDRLPTAVYRDATGRPIRQLVYATSSTQNEFWTALLEKAYAKLCGCYEALRGGRPLDSMEDFTGGIGESFELKPEESEKSWKIMAKAYERKSLMCCGTCAGPKTKDGCLQNGLGAGHAYSVTKVSSCNTKKLGNLQMVRVRNPWGDHDKDWKGEWSDEHLPEKLKQLSGFEKQEIGFEDVKEDGEFWMTVEEFVKNFADLDICHLNPEYFANNDAALNETHWNVKCYHGCWKDEISAGGFVDEEKFCTNPQYGFQVVDVDEDDDKDVGTVIIALMQKDRRKNRLDNLTIGFAVYKLRSPLSAPLDKNYNFHDISNNTPMYDGRELCERLYLRPGSYCVVPYRLPSKNVPNDGDFLLRIFIEKPFTSSLLPIFPGRKLPQPDNIDVTEN